MSDATDRGNIGPDTVAGGTLGDGTLGLSGNMAESPQDDGMTHDGLGSPATKRRRVTRACDECRRKKIKCDGKQVRSPSLPLLLNDADHSHVHIVRYIHTVRCLHDVL